MNEAAALVLSLSLSGSILAVLIFALKPLIKHRLPKSMQYYIWIVVLVRLVFPFSMENNIMNEVFNGNDATLAAGSQIEKSTAAKVEKSTNNSIILPDVKENTAKGIYNSDTDYSRYFRDLFNQYLLYIWLIGVITALIVNLFGYFRFLKYIRRANVPAADGENRMMTALLKEDHNVRLVRNRFAATPMLIGIIRPVIIIPDIYYNEKQLGSILLHEITHLKRFDIGIKWLTMIVASLHWFNPLMHFIKKEINRACELSCDEMAIKNLNSAEKQAYGDTLIDVVSDTKYPIGVLQATMSEEKNALKERLVAIMKYGKESKMCMIISVFLFLSVVFSALYLGGGVVMGSDVPPKIYISAEGERTREALTGSYNWKSLGRITHADSDDPVNFKYQIENTVSLTANQQIVIGTQKIKTDNKCEFTIEQISVYKDGRMTEVGSVEPSFLNGNLYLQGPQEAGEYIYCLRLSFKDKGTVSYGFVVRVDMLTYNLTEISKYKTPYVGDASKVGSIVKQLPVPDHYFRQQYISMKTSEKPYNLTIYYEAASDAKYEGAWPIVVPDSAIETNSRTNALVVFCMIDNLDEVTFAYRVSQSSGELDDSKYDTSFTFQRAWFEEKYGDLSVFGRNLDTLKDVLAGDKLKLMPEFTDAEVTAARKVVEEYYRATAAKDDEAILATWHPSRNYTIERVKSGNIILYGTEIRTLKTIDYDSQDRMRQNYRPGGSHIAAENIIVFKVSFSIEYPLKDGGPWNEGMYNNWSMILVRDDVNSPWFIYDQGY